MVDLTRVVVTAAALVMLSACAAPISEQKQAGFLSDYSQLVPMDKGAYRFTSPAIADYRQLIIEEPVFLLSTQPGNDKRGFSEDELAAVGDYIKARLQKVLTRDERFEIVERAGPGVARVRVALTAIGASRGIFNVLLYTRVTGAGLGGAAIEAEVVDALSNEQLCASVQWGNDSRFLRAGFTKMGGAKLQAKRWIKSLDKRIKEADAL